MTAEPDINQICGGPALPPTKFAHHPSVSKINLAYPEVFYVVLVVTLDLKKRSIVGRDTHPIEYARTQVRGPLDSRVAAYLSS